MEYPSSRDAACTGLPRRIRPHKKPSRADRLSALPASLPPCQPASLPVQDLRTDNELAGASVSQSVRECEFFLLGSFSFFLSVLLRHSCNYAVVSLTQQSSNASLVGRDQLAKGCMSGPVAGLHWGPQHQES